MLLNDRQKEMLKELMAVMSRAGVTRAALAQAGDLKASALSASVATDNRSIPDPKLGALLEYAKEKLESGINVDEIGDQNRVSQALEIATTLIAAVDVNINADAGVASTTPSAHRPGQQISPFSPALYASNNFRKLTDDVIPNREAGYELTLGWLHVFSGPGMGATTFLENIKYLATPLSIDVIYPEVRGIAKRHQDLNEIAAEMLTAITGDTAASRRIRDCSPFELTNELTNSLKYFLHKRSPRSANKKTIIVLDTIEDFFHQDFDYKENAVRLGALFGAFKMVEGLCLLTVSPPYCTPDLNIDAGEVSDTFRQATDLFNARLSEIDLMEWSRARGCSVEGREAEEVLEISTGHTYLIDTYFYFRTQGKLSHGPALKLLSDMCVLDASEVEFPAELEDEKRSILSNFRKLRTNIALTLKRALLVYAHYDPAAAHKMRETLKEKPEGNSAIHRFVRACGLVHHKKLGPLGQSIIEEISSAGGNS